MADTARATCITWSSIYPKTFSLTLDQVQSGSFPKQRPEQGQLLHLRASELDREGKERQTGPAPQIGQRPSRDF